MPQRAKRNCTHPGCGVATAGGKCAKHRKPAWHKPKGRDAYYDTVEWRTLRAAVIARDPICKLCHKSKSKVADHRTARRDGGTDTMDNLQGVCWPCSNKKTRQEQINRVKKDSGTLKEIRTGVKIIVDEEL